MKLIKQLTDLNKAIKNSQKLGFVPTMGGIHKGHESLINISKKKCKQTIVSIFINPKQFNNKKDFKTYPRNLSKDLKILKKLKVDFVFLPTAKKIYKNRQFAKFKLDKSDVILCAKYRKGHFEGVLDVMNRFIYFISPNYVFMGEKDYQQFFLIRKFLSKKYNTKILLCKTIRNKKKVALSSRNYLLNENYINKASLIAKSLIELKAKINKKKSIAMYLIKNIKKDLINKYNIKIEYLETRNIFNLKKTIIKKRYKIFIAYYLNNVRLIDNF